MKSSLTIRNGRLHVQTGYSPALVERFRAIPDRKFHPEDKSWSFSIHKDVILMVLDTCGMLPWMLPDDVRKVVESSGLDMPKPNPVDLSVLNDHVFSQPPFDHQKLGLARLLTENRWMDASEMGVGKSAIIANRLKYMKDDEQCLIVCPKSVIYGWREQLKEHAGLDCVAIDGDREKRTINIRRDWPRIKVSGYESLLYTPAFYNVAWTYLVGDELQKCKNFSAQTSKSFRVLSEKATYVYGLSGTPAPNGLQDWQGVLACIKPDLLPVRTKTAFESRYCVKEAMGPNGTPPCRISGYRNVQELHGYIASITSRVTKAEALDLPPKTYSSRVVTLDGEQARIYRDLKKDAVARLLTLKQEGTISLRNVLTESLRLLQVVGGFVPLDDGRVHELDKKAKLSALADVLDEAGNKQVVIWCCFRDEVSFLMKWLPENYGPTASLMGGMGLEDRFENVQAFREGTARYFVGTAAAGGTGINGLHVADTCVYYSRDHNFASYAQSQDRCHRIGTKSAVSIIKLIAANTVDVRVDESLDNKGAMLEMMLRNPEDML